MARSKNGYEMSLSDHDEDRETLPTCSCAMTRWLLTYAKKDPNTTIEVLDIRWTILKKLSVRLFEARLDDAWVY